MDEIIGKKIIQVEIVDSRDLVLYFDDNSVMEISADSVFYCGSFNHDRLLVEVRDSNGILTSDITIEAY